MEFEKCAECGSEPKHCEKGLFCDNPSCPLPIGVLTIFHWQDHQRMIRAEKLVKEQDDMLKGIALEHIDVSRTLMKAHEKIKDLDNWLETVTKKTLRDAP